MIQNNKDDDLHPDTFPIVPYVPFRCPNCNRHKPFTSNVRGRVRQHRCQACGMRYRSYELDATAVPDRGFAVPPPPE